MSLPKYSELKSLNTLEEIENELFVLQKSLFYLRIKKLTNQNLKNHLFSHTKHRISQLKLKQYLLIKK
jgi:large subunit ribosomal protein L29